MKLTEHKKCLHQQKPSPINYALLITSDSRTPKTDITGKTIIKLLKNHNCLHQEIVKNNADLIRRKVKSLLSKTKIQLIITSGGTGCGKRDISIESVSSLIDKQMEGFGELFRMLSYKEIGSSAFMSRVILGITQNRKIICCFPGSVNAVKLALTKLLIPELPHLFWEIRRN